MGSGSGGGLNAQQTAQLQSLLKATKVPATSLPGTLLNVTGAPTASSTSSLAADARMTLLKRQGYDATVASDPTFGQVGMKKHKPIMGVSGHGSLGDAGFGTSLLKPSAPLAYGGKP